MEADLRETWTFYTSASSSKLEEANSCTQTGPSQAQPGSVDEDINSEEHGSSRQVAQGRLHTISDFVWHMNPAQVDPEPNQSVVAFRP